MAIPDTNTFTLQDVVTEIIPTTNDLVDCFADSTDALFDPAYKGNKTNLLNFRNYGGSHLEVVIGTQTWKVRNVDDAITGSKVYDDDEDNRIIYGGLYTWAMIADIETANPGWHVPTKTEFDTLVSYLGGIILSGGKLKEVGISHWQTPNTDATNETGFTGLPGGLYTSSTYNQIYQKACFWTNSEYNEFNSYYNDLSYNTGWCTQQTGGKLSFLSIRLLKD